MIPVQSRQATPLPMVPEFPVASDDQSGQAMGCGQRKKRQRNREKETLNGGIVKTESRSRGSHAKTCHGLRRHSFAYHLLILSATL